MASYYLLETAQRDLQGIWRYYDRLGGVQLAAQQIADLHLRFELLSDFPYMGRERPELANGIRTLFPLALHTRFSISRWRAG